MCTPEAKSLLLPLKTSESFVKLGSMRSVTSVVEKALQVPLSFDDAKTQIEASERRQTASTKRTKTNAINMSRDAKDGTEAGILDDADDESVENRLLFMPSVSGGCETYTYDDLMRLTRSMLNNLATEYLKLPPTSNIRREAFVSRMLRTSRARCAEPEAVDLFIDKVQS